MKIDILCHDGSPLGVTLRHLRGIGRIGVGGAEYALLTMCETWGDFGHQVRLYNDPIGSIENQPFAQYSIASFRPEEDRDILIIFRSPSALSYRAKGKKIFWSCDQYTVGDFKAFASRVDKVVVISPFHKKYFETAYGIEGAVVTDLPVRTWEYEDVEENKDVNEVIFTSVPDRGAQHLLPIWKKITAVLPNLHLTITSDYRLWGAPVASNGQHVQAWSGVPNVTFRGAVVRPDLVKIQNKAAWHLYPCVYDELFCISVAESQVAQVIPVTTSVGALATTNMGYQASLENLADEFLAAYEVGWSSDFSAFRLARERFSPEVIAAFWEKEIFA